MNLTVPQEHMKSQTSRRRSRHSASQACSTKEYICVVPWKPSSVLPCVRYVRNSFERDETSAPFGVISAHCTNSIPFCPQLCARFTSRSLLRMLGRELCKLVLASHGTRHEVSIQAQERAHRTPGPRGQRVTCGHAGYVVSSTDVTECPHELSFALNERSCIIALDVHQSLVSSDVGLYRFAAFD